MCYAYIFGPQVVACLLPSRRTCFLALPRSQIYRKQKMFLCLPMMPLPTFRFYKDLCSMQNVCLAMLLLYYEEFPCIILVSLELSLGKACNVRR
jgi:hypothetical protein